MIVKIKRKKENAHIYIQWYGFFFVGILEKYGSIKFLLFCIGVLYLSLQLEGDRVWRLLSIWIVKGLRRTIKIYHHWILYAFVCTRTTHNRISRRYDKLYICVNKYLYVRVPVYSFKWGNIINYLWSVCILYIHTNGLFRVMEAHI